MPIDYKEWEQISADPEYQKLPEGEKYKIKRNWANAGFSAEEGYNELPPDVKERVLSKAVQFGGDISIPSPDVAPERGLAGDIGSSLARGGVNLVEGVAGALRMADFNPETDEGFLGRVGVNLSEHVKKWRQRSEILKPDVSEAAGEQGFAKRAVTGAAESLAPSMGPLAAAAGGAKVGAGIGTALAGPPGTAFGAGVGAILAGGAALFSTFVLGTYQNTYDSTVTELKDKGVPEQEAIEKAKDHALVSSIAEGGFEAGSDLLTAGFFKLLGGKVVSQPIKQTIRDLLGDSGKEFGKALAKSAPTEIASEMATGYVQASSAQKAGIDTVSPIDAAIESIGPSAILSVFMGSAFHGVNKLKAKQVYSDLNNEDAARRQNAVDFIASRLDKDSSAKWKEAAGSYIANGQRIDISKPIVDFTIQKVDQDIQNGEETPVSEEVKKEPTYQQLNQVKIESTDLETGRVSPNIRNQAIINEQMPADIETIDQAPTIQAKAEVAQAQVDEATKPQMFVGPSQVALRPSSGRVPGAEVNLSKLGQEIARKRLGGELPSERTQPVITPTGKKRLIDLKVVNPIAPNGFDRVVAPGGKVRLVPKEPVQAEPAAISQQPVNPNAFLQAEALKKGQPATVKDSLQVAPAQAPVTLPSHKIDEQTQPVTPELTPNIRQGANTAQEKTWGDTVYGRTRQNVNVDEVKSDKTLMESVVPSVKTAIIDSIKKLRKGVAKSLNKSSDVKATDLPTTSDFIIAKRKPKNYKGHVISSIDEHIVSGNKIKLLPPESDYASRTIAFLNIDGSIDSIALGSRTGFGGVAARKQLNSIGKSDLTHGSELSLDGIDAAFVFDLDKVHGSTLNIFRNLQNKAQVKATAEALPKPDDTVTSQPIQGDIQDEQTVQTKVAAAEEAAGIPQKQTKGITNEKETRPETGSGEVQPERETEGQGQTKGEEKEVAAERPAEPSRGKPVEIKPITEKAKVTFNEAKTGDDFKIETEGGERYSLGDVTETPAFKKWFGDSKVVDEDGKPLVVYHGTNSDINEFSKDALGATTGAASAKKGFFFVAEKNVAQTYFENGFWGSVELGRSSGNLMAQANRVRYEAEYEVDFISKTIAREIISRLAPVIRGKKTSANVAGAIFGRYPSEVENFGGQAAVQNEIDRIISLNETPTQDALKGEYFNRLFNKKTPSLSEEIKKINDRGIKECYLSIKNPYIHDFKGEKYREESYSDIITKAKTTVKGRKRYDGVIFKNTFDAWGGDRAGAKPYDVFVVFEPTQIKSIYNRGTFDPGNPDIRYALSAEDKTQQQALLDDLNSTPTFKGRVSVDNSGKITMRLKDGREFEFKQVDDLEADETAARKGYGPEAEGLTVKGALIGNIVYRTKNGDKWTLLHEGQHISEQAGLINDIEKGILTRAAKRAGISQKLSPEEQRANFIEQALKERDSYRGTITGRILQKIGDFLDKIASLLHLTSRGLVRQFESGEVFDREPGETSDQGPQYALLKSDQSGIDNEMSEYFGRSTKTFTEKVGDAFQSLRTVAGRNDAMNEAIRITVDRLNPIKTDLDLRSYKLARNINGFQQVFTAFLRHGKLDFEGDAPIVKTKGQGVMPFLESVGVDWKKFLYWVAAKRAVVLEGQNRENWLDKTARDEIFSKTAPENSARFEKANKQFKEFNDNILDFAEKAGLIDPEARAQWQQYYYVPFYRIFENEEEREAFLAAPKWSKKHIDAQIKKLKGADQKLGDPLENMLHNWVHLIHESMRNNARAAAFDSAIGKGLAEEIKYMGKEITAKMRKADNVLSFRRNGKAVYFKVSDPALFAALADTKPQIMDNFIIKMMGSTKQLLTRGATFGPVFRINNMLRDTVHTAITQKDFKPFIDTWRGFKKTLLKDQDYIEFLSSGNSFGQDYLASENPEKISKYIKEILDKEGKGGLKRILSTPKKVLNFWDEIGHASENAARLALYLNKKKAGMSHFDASFEARDVLDFSMKGASEAVQLITAITPFLNARMQGLYKLGRAAKEDTKPFLIKGAMLTAASIALWAAFKDDERYKELKDYEKWAFYHFWIGDVHFRIPKPFEVGLIFSSAPETLLNVINGTENGNHITDFIGYSARNTLAADVPQLVKPIAEQWANKSFFTGSPIVGMGLENLPAGQQSDPYTSESMRWLGERLNISPKRAEALVRGYFSTIGLYAMGLSDIFTRYAADFPERPSRTMDDYLGGMIKRGGPPQSTKYNDRFYEFFNEVDSIARGIKVYKMSGETAKAKELFDENRQELKFKPAATNVRGKITTINKQMKIVMGLKIDSDEKRKRLDSLVESKNKLLKNFYKLMNQ